MNSAVSGLKGTILVIALVCLLILGVLPSTASAGSQGNSPANSSQPKADHKEANASHSLPNWRSEGRDWQSYSGADGYVDVIVSTGEGAPSESAHKKLSKLAYERMPASDAQHMMQSIDQGFRSEFSLPFCGASIHIRTEMISELLDLDSSIQIYPDLSVKAMLSENIVQVGADQVWSLLDSGGVPVKGSGVVVAVVDTGVDYMHPDLGAGFGSGYKVIGGYDFFNKDSDPMDDNGHGTHVAGIIGANGGMTGVAPEANILAYKVLGADGSGQMSMVISGIQAAIDPNGDGNYSDHADVISMSLGGSGEINDPLCLAVREAVELGAVVVIAAGNDGPNFGTVASPGIVPEAVTVGAIDSGNALAEFSSRGTAPDLLVKPEICAPGVRIVSTVPYSNAMFASTSGYLSMSGTSMATPHVSGAAALLLQLHPELTPAQVKSALVTGVSSVDAPLWYAGAGGLWIPTSADTDVFATQPVVSYGLATETSKSISLRNGGTDAIFSLSITDCRILSYNGSIGARIWTNLSSVQPTSVNIPSLGAASISLQVHIPSSNPVEGYYEGSIVLRSDSREIQIPFGFAILTRLNVHVLGLSGYEISDSGGLVWVYSVPDAAFSTGTWAKSTPVPPASFILPAGNYSVHAAGHQLLYSYSDPYILSSVVSLAPGEDRTLNLSMSNARKMTLDLRTEDGNPIYAKDFRMYCRYAGEENNVSFHVHDFDYSKVGSALFSLPLSRNIYISDTAATIGISIAGFSYSSGMWDFMALNWQRWYEWINSTSTKFRIEATADLQYLLSWEFDGVNSSTPLSLCISRDRASIHETKYDIPGAIGEIWGLWDTHRAMGADATFYERRVTGASLNGFFTGITRKTIVQGVFSELYWPGSILENYMERDLYIPDYGHTVAASSDTTVSFPDRNYLIPLPAGSITERIGSGPFYPSVFTSNTNVTLVLFHPLLVDQAGARINGLSTPTMSVTRDGKSIGAYKLEEISAPLNGIRTISLPGPGSYVAAINLITSSQICNQVVINLGFSVPSADRNPPRLNYFQMPERFVPGETVNMLFGASDDSSSISASVSWRPGIGGSWENLTVTPLGSGKYAASIQTQATTKAIDLRMRLSDPSGNFMEYSASNSSLKQIPVRLEISPDVLELKYRSQIATVTLTGKLTDVEGKPLSPSGGIPLELTVAGRKVAMILDEYVLSDSHSHNGSIRFDWSVNPTKLFSGPNETVEVSVLFDLGIYEPIERTFQLSSIYDSVNPPTISTVPGNGSCISAGSSVTVVVVDDGQITASSYSIDGAQDWKPLLLTINAPNSWVALVGTSGLSDGVHELRLSVTDDDQITVRTSVMFEVDATSPRIEFDGLTNGTQIPTDWRIKVNASDTHLLGMNYSLDNVESSFVFSTSEAMTYFVETHGLGQGTHELTVSAKDKVGHVSSNTLHFEIVNSSVTAVLVSPRQDSSGETVIRSGTPIVLSIFGLGEIMCVWTEAQVAHTVSAPYEISTSGWIEGQHDIMISVSNNLGGVFTLEVILSVDDTPPNLFVAPLNGTFVGSKDQVVIDVTESHLATVSWRILNNQSQTTGSHVVIPLDGLSFNGLFSVEIVANDKAGNCRAVVVTYTMDIAAPILGVEGVASGEAIPAGRELSLSVQDISLSSVRWSMDAGDLTSIARPYSIDTRLFTAGYHVLTLTAEDSVGLSSWFNISIYVDRAPPVIVQKCNGYYEIGSTFEMQANITDDFVVERVFLLFELQNGSFERIPMDKSGSIFRANLSNDMLWDGMTVFIQATDSVGNLAESNHVMLQARSGTHDPAGNPVRGLPLGNFGLISMIAVGLIVSIAFIVQHNHPVRDTERLSNGRGRRTAPPLARTRNEAKIDSPRIASHSSYNQTAPQPTRVTRPNASTVASGSFEPVSSVKKEVMPLLDAIPVILSVPKEDSVGTSDEDVDYGALIERELIIPSIKNSVFSDLMKEAKNIPLVKAVKDPRILPQIEKKRITGARDTFF